MCIISLAFACCAQGYPSHAAQCCPPAPPSSHSCAAGWGGGHYRIEGPSHRPFDVVSRLSACRPGEGPEEEEKDEPDSDAEEEEHPCIPPLVRTWFRAFFPNTPPFVWFFLQFFVCFLLLLMGLESVSASKPDFFLARAPLNWAPTTPDAKPPLEVVSRGHRTNSISESPTVADTQDGISYTSLSNPQGGARAAWGLFECR